ncbi:hypothetical protein QR685DRAFT_207250 [Neurospora intermedia]|uniref:Uncharacterized protein n=1 Tax=Neurospora intermedia TaxID=5142 RepID=A0ABR3DFW6_NEUIN
MAESPLITISIHHSHVRATSRRSKTRQHVFGYSQSWRRDITRDMHLCGFYHISGKSRGVPSNPSDLPGHRASHSDTIKEHLKEAVPRQCKYGNALFPIVRESFSFGSPVPRPRPIGGLLRTNSIPAIQLNQLLAPVSARLLSPTPGLARLRELPNSGPKCHNHLVTHRTRPVTQRRPIRSDIDKREPPPKEKKKKNNEAIAGTGPPLLVPVCSARSVRGARNALIGEHLHYTSSTPRPSKVKGWTSDRRFPSSRIVSVCAIMDADTEPFFFIHSTLNDGSV